MSTPSTAPDPERNAANRELSAILEEEIDGLPDAFRTVFMLRAIEELSVEEAAECLEIPEETVRTRYFRARGLLQKALAERLEAATPAVYAFHLSRCDRIVGAVMRRIGS
jgi:RNA polymerase sigma-70 factor (ECF subfamily)